MIRHRIQSDAQPTRQADRGPDRGLRLEQTFLVRAEQVVDDETPDPAPPNRATRRAMQRAARRKNRS